MKNILFAFVFVLLFPISIYAQLKGKIIDQETFNPVSNAEIFVLKKDSTIIESTVSDSLGFFHLRAQNPYIISIRHLGYEPFIAKTAQVNFIDPIKIKQKSITLSNVIVIGHTRYKALGIETIVVTDSLRDGVNTSAMLLNKIKGIRVDEISEKIKIGREENVLVVVNGKEVPYEYAMSINPSRVRKIEIIQRPDGKFSDYPVVVNLEMIEGYIGWDVSPRLTAMSSVRYGYTNREKVSIDGTWSLSRWNFYGTLNFDTKKLFDVSSFKKIYGSVYKETTMPIKLTSPNLQTLRHNSLLNLGIDYRLAKKHTISLQTLLGVDVQKRHEAYVVSVEDFLGSFKKKQQSDNKYASKGYAINLSYRGIPLDNLKLNAVFLYNYYGVKEEKNYNLENIYSSENRYFGNKNYLSQSIDAVYRISNRWSISLSNTFVWRRYNSQEYNTKEVAYYSENFRNKLSAALKFSSGDKFEICGGGMFQSIHDHNNRKENRLFSEFIPYMKFFWQPMPTVSFDFNYFNIIDYPTLDQLSPLSWSIDKYLTHTGNPNLKARSMHYAEAQLSLRDVLKVTYMNKKSKNDILPYYTKTKPNHFTETFINCNFEHSYIGLEGNYTLWKGVELSLLLNYQWYARYKESKKKHYGYSYTIDSQLSYTIPNIKVRLMTNYYLRYDLFPLLQGREYFQEELFSVGANKMFFHDKMAVSLVVSLPTKIIPKNTYKEIDIPDFKYQSYGDGRINSFVLSLNIRLLLGNKKSKSNTQGIQIEQEK